MTTANTADARFGFDTRQVHAGETFSGANPRITPIHQTAGYLFDSFDHTADRFSGDDLGFIYSRVSNPTNAVAEARLAALESGVGSLLTGSGQAAITVALLSLAGAGDHILSSVNLYEGTRALFRGAFKRLGIEVEFVTDPNNAEAWASRVRPNTKAFYGEPLSNPTNQVLDLTTVAETAHAHGVPLVVDNTLATPYLLRPIEHGTDVVVHSTSKFLSGHGTTIGGALTDAGTFPWADHSDRFPQFLEPVRPGKASFLEHFAEKTFWGYSRVRPAADFGPSYSALHTFLLLQGIDTLSLRLARHSENALAIARWLAEQPEVERVHHPLLDQHPHHDLAKRYLPDGSTPVFSFDLRGGKDAARTFIDSVELFSRMTHIGDVRSLILNPATTTHRRLTEQERQEVFVQPGTVRLSVGIETLDDLIADLDAGFQRLRAG